MTINTETILAGLRMLNTDLYGDYKIPEQVLQERANNIATALMGELEETLSKTVIKAIVEKERLIYWLLRLTHEDDEPEKLYGAYECLSDLGYELGGPRVLRMIALGEPGVVG